MIDCHAHLASPEFDADRSEVLDRAEGSGVGKVLVVGEDLADDEWVLEVCSRDPRRLAPCIGLHPDRFAEGRAAPSSEQLDAIESLARSARARIVAIGEVGLDYWYVKSEERRAAQRAALERMVALGVELDLPLNVHSRSAGHHTLDLLAAVGARRALLHAFDGKAQYARRAHEAHGWLFSIPPSVVRSEQKQKLVRALPLEALALESDSPVLGPTPKTRNEPANLALAAQLIAELQGVSVERVREVTTANALGLFRLT